MLKKIAFAAGIASIALMPALATPKAERTKAEEAARDAAEAAEAAAKAAADAADDAAADAEPSTDVGMAAYDPFAGLKDLALKKPLVELPAPDPARLALADQVMGKLMADGTYARIMNSTQDEILQPLLDRVWNMKGSEFADLFGFKDMPPSSKDETFGENFGKNDPYAKQRIEAFMHVYFRLIGQMSGAIEPDVRSAMARDFARKFDAQQLADLNRFLATPSGSAFAKNYMMSSFSLDVLQTSLMVWPKMMKAVPDFAKQLKEADAALPPRPQPVYDMASDDSLPDCAKDGGYDSCTDADWDAQRNKERDAWSKKDRAAVEKAEAKLAKAQGELDALYDRISAARDEVDRLTNDARSNAGQGIAMPMPVPVIAVPAPVAPPATQ